MGSPFAGGVDAPASACLPRGRSSITARPRMKGYDADEILKLSAARRIQFNPQCGRGLADSKRQVHRTDVATSPPTMWTAASSEIVACYYAHATRTVYRLEQHNPRSPTPTRVDERQQGPELSQRSGLELDGRHGSLRRQARRQGPGNAVLFRSRSVSWIPAADERLDNSRLH